MGLLQKHAGMGTGWALEAASKFFFVVHKDIEQVDVLVADGRGPHDEVFRVHVLEEVHSARVVSQIAAHLYQFCSGIDPTFSYQSHSKTISSGSFPRRAMNIGLDDVVKFIHYEFLKSIHGIGFA